MFDLKAILSIYLTPATSFTTADRLSRIKYDGMRETLSDHYTGVELIQIDGVNYRIKLERVPKLESAP